MIQRLQIVGLPNTKSVSVCLCVCVARSKHTHMHRWIYRPVIPAENGL